MASGSSTQLIAVGQLQILPRIASDFIWFSWSFVNSMLILLEVCVEDEVGRAALKARLTSVTFVIFPRTKYLEYFWTEYFAFFSCVLQPETLTASIIFPVYCLHWPCMSMSICTGPMCQCRELKHFGATPFSLHQSTQTLPALQMQIYKYGHHKLLTLLAPFSSCCAFHTGQFCTLYHFLQQARAVLMIFTFSTLQASSSQYQPRKWGSREMKTK